MVLIHRIHILTHPAHINPVVKSFDIFRDYLMAFWLSPKVSTRDPIISPRAKALGLIMGSLVDTLGDNQNPIHFTISTHLT